MKNSILLPVLIILIVLSSCKKEDDITQPILDQSANISYLQTLEEGATYAIKESTLYQYDENGTYTFGDTLITHERSNLGGIKISNHGDGYFHSNIIPEGGFNDGDPQYPGDIYPPLRPWGSSTDYNHVFNFGMISYIVNNDNTIDFCLYALLCSGDTMFFNSSMEIVPNMQSNNTIRLEQFRQGNLVYGKNERRITYLLEKQ